MLGGVAVRAVWGAAGCVKELMRPRTNSIGNKGKAQLSGRGRGVIIGTSCAVGYAAGGLSEGGRSWMSSGRRPAIRIPMRRTAAAHEMQ